MLGLGRLYDIGLGAAPVDLATAGITGKRIAMTNCGGVDIVLVYGAGGASDNPVPSLQQHTAYTGGTTATLAVIDKFWHKSETLLDNDETWVKETQTAAAIITAITGEGAKEKIYVIHVPSASLSDGYTHMSVNQADPGATAQLVCALYLRVDLVHMRAPVLLPNLLNPGAVNV